MNVAQHTVYKIYSIYVLDRCTYICFRITLVFFRFFLPFIRCLLNKLLISWHTTSYNKIVTLQDTFISLLHQKRCKANCKITIKTVGFKSFSNISIVPYFKPLQINMFIECQNGIEQKQKHCYLFVEEILK